MIGGRDAEDVRSRDRVDHLVAAFEDDADRHAALRGDAPRRVDTGAFVDDRDCVAADGAADVGDGARGGEPAVERLDLQVVRRAADADAVRVHLARREPRTVLDRAPEVRRARERRVHEHDERASLVGARFERAAAAGEQQQGEERHEEAHRPHL